MKKNVVSRMFVSDELIGIRTDKFFPKIPNDERFFRLGFHNQPKNFQKFSRTVHVYESCPTVSVWLGKLFRLIFYLGLIVKMCLTI